MQDEPMQDGPLQHWSLQDWADRSADLVRLAERQLFFVGGAPRSGTTWLQQILDCHPDICCRGEGFLQTQLAAPIAAMMVHRRAALEAKNAALFRHTGGYPLPTVNDSDLLTRTAILVSLRRQYSGEAPLAIGEKTPENVFFFPYLRRIFATAKFIAIARDPRDVLTSAWHFFHCPMDSEDETAAKTAFLRAGIPPLRDGAQAMLAFQSAHPECYRMVTYEALHDDPGPVIAGLFRFLGVADAPPIVAQCIERSSFEAATSGRPTGSARNGAFLRKGVVGDWVSTLTPQMNAMLLAELGFIFPHFGWRP